MPQGVLLLHDFIDGDLKCFQRAMETIGDRQLFEVEPETFNRVEERAVLGQPDDQESVFIEAQGRLNGLAVMVRSVVHDQNEMLTRIVLPQMFKESHKGIAVFMGSGQITDPPAVPVVTAEDMQILGATGSRDQFTFRTTHPTATQRRMQTHGRFVHKDEFGVGNGVKGDVFFNQSIT